MASWAREPRGLNWPESEARAQEELKVKEGVQLWTARARKPGDLDWPRNGDRPRRGQRSRKGHCHRLIGLETCRQGG